MAQISLDELQARLIYCLIVAGKSAGFADACTQKLLLSAEPGERPFDLIRRLIAKKRLKKRLKQCKTGNYNKLRRALEELVNIEIDLSSCSAEQLEEIHGIGPKTARFFLLWTRPNALHAALDVHVLRWMRKQGYDAPESTPTGERYRALEWAFIVEARRRGMRPRELDERIWSQGAKRPMTDSLTGSDKCS